MKILYSSVHAVLEFDEVKLFTEMGHEVFSLGAYSNGGVGHFSLPRPSIGGMKEFPDFLKLSGEFPRRDLPQQLFEWADIIINMHDPYFIVGNWEKIKSLGKANKTIQRFIGQSTATVENMIRPMRYEGMKIVRMSQKEESITGFVGSDALIRFYKDPEEWSGWTGNERRVINLSQSLKGRSLCHYDQIMQAIEGFPALIYGVGNTDLGPLDGGRLSYDLIKGALRDNRVFIYGGTWPSPYTLALQEAMMSGIPVVAIGPE